MNDRELIDPGQMRGETSVGTVRKTPLLLYGLFVELLRQIYSEEIQDPELGWVWAGKDGSQDTDPESSDVWIDAEYKWNDAHPDMRPAVYVALGPIKYAPTAGGSRGLTHIDLKEGEYEYTRTGTGTLTVVHIGSTKGEGVRLATLTHDYLDAFSDVIRQEYCFKQFNVVEAVPAQVVKEEKDNIRSLVSATFSFEDTWTLKLESPRLMRVAFAAGQRTLDMLR